MVIVGIVSEKNLVTSMMDVELHKGSLGNEPLQYPIRATTSLMHWPR